MTHRILYVIDGLNVGGAETLLLDLLDAALTRGDAAHVAYFSDGPLGAEVAARGIGLTRLSRTGLRDPRALHRMVRLIRRWRPDVVHTHLTKAGIVGQIAARVTGTPRVQTLHNVDPWRRRAWLSRAWRWATDGADACIAVSSEVADHVAATGGHSRARIEVIPNGADLSRFDPEGTEPLPLSRFGLDRGAVVFAAIGRLTDQKDHATYLRAVAKVAREMPDTRFVVVGVGPLDSDLRDLAASLRLGPDRVAFLGGQRDMPALLASVDVMVLSSRWEGLPMVLLEAMAMGVPVLSTAVGGVPRVIEDWKTGLLVPPGAPELLAERMRRLAVDPHLRKTLGAAGRRLVEAEFDAAGMLDRLWAIYDRCGTSRRGQVAPAKPGGQGGEPLRAAPTGE